MQRNLKWCCETSINDPLFKTGVMKRKSKINEMRKIGSEGWVQVSQSRIPRLWKKSFCCNG